MRIRTVVLCCLTGILAFPTVTASAAAPLYVDKFGSDTNPCTRVQPCLTISEAVSRAQAYGRIIVGPGKYTERFTITQTGLRITSSGGSALTTINTAQEGSFSALGIQILADRVVFGQRDRGFTLEAGFTDPGTEFAAGAIYALGDWNRVEGNVIEIASRAFSAVMQGNNLVFRYNRVHNLDSGEAGTGLLMSRPVEDQPGGLGWLADNNYISGFGVAYRFISNSPNNRMRVTNNIADRVGSGFLVQNQEVSSGVELPSQLRSGDRHSNNSANLVGEFGVGFEFRGGGPRADRLRVRLPDQNDTGIMLRNTKSASLANSIVSGEFPDAVDPNRGPPNEALQIIESPGARIFRNSFLNTHKGVSWSGDATRGQFFNNNVWNTTNCALILSEALVPTNLVFRQNFWGDAAGPDTSCSDSTQSLIEDAVVRLRPAANPN